MTSMAKIKPLCRNIIVVYTHHVRDMVKDGKIKYIETGIDDDIYVYKELFLEILGLALGVSDKEPNINKEVKEETIVIIKREMSSRKYRKILANYRLLIYTTCELIFEKVMEEIKHEIR